MDAFRLFPKITNFLYVCQSIRWLTSLLKLYQYLLFWKIYFGYIPGMFSHYFKIIIIFLYVCQPVSWLTSLLKLDKYRFISCSVWNIFLKISGDILRMFLHYFQIIPYFLYVCQAVSWLTFLLKLYKYSDFSSSVWDIFLNYFGDEPLMFLY